MNCITRDELIKAKRFALRLKIWYKLEKAIRSIVDLSIRVIKVRVKSHMLNEVLQGILLEIMGHKFSWRARRIGLRLALRRVKLAISWGYAEALEWLRNGSYTIFLGANYINSPEAYQLE